MLQHPHRAPLLDLLRPLLPSSLLLYNTLLLPGSEHVPIWTSFVPDQLPQQREDGEGWTMLADYGNQLRLFHCFEGREELGTKEQEEAEELVMTSLRSWFRQLPPSRPGMITLGAIHERWLPCIKREVEVESCYEYWLHLASEPLSPVEVEAEVKLPEGCWLGQVGEEYVEEILSTSGVPHPPSYIVSRLPYSTALFSSPSPSSSSAPSSTELLASCLTHLDGSLGTLHVSPSHRRRGLARLVISARQAAVRASLPAEERERSRGFAYVGEGNRESRALMGALGWGEAWRVSWVRTKRETWERPRVEV